jgi:hypothetical protein
MTTGFVTEYQGRIVGITKNEVKIITPDMVLPKQVTWFTNIVRRESDSAHFIGDKPFGEPQNNIEGYKSLVSAIDKQFVKPFEVTNESSLFNFIRNRIEPNVRTLCVPPEHIKNNILTNIGCATKRSGEVQEIATQCNLNQYRIPSIFGNFKVSTHKAGTKIGIYHCNLLNPIGNAGIILPPGDYWLTHIQVKFLRSYYDIVIKESYTFHHSKQVDVPIIEHPGFSALFSKGYNSHKITQCLIEEYLFSIPGIKQGSINPISVMLRSQRWLKSFKTAISMSENGLEVYTVNYNKIIVEN